MILLMNGKSLFYLKLNLNLLNPLLSLLSAG